MKLKKRKRWLYFIGLLAGLMLTGVALAQVSTNFDLSWHLLSGGGGARDSANYRVDDSLGQWAKRTSSSANHGIEPGFWYEVVVTPTDVTNLAIGKSGPATATAGEPITYTITITNAGPDTVDAVVTDTFTTGAVASISSSTGCSGSGPVVCSLDDFTGTQTITLVLTTSVSFSGTLVNSGFITPTVPTDAETAPGDNVDSVTTAVRYPAADLQIGKVHQGDDDVIAGEPITYTLTITNAGPDTVDAVMTDTFTAGTMASIITSTGSCSGSGSRPVLCSFHRFTGTEIITLTINTSAIFTGTLTNNAVISTIPYAVDTDPSNNQGSDDVEVVAQSRTHVFLPLILQGG